MIGIALQTSKRLAQKLSVILLLGSILTPPVSAQLSLSQLEEQELLYLREEEKLARDVYTALFATSGQQIFGNIAQS